MLLKNELTLIEEYVIESHQLNPEVSSKSIDWHLDHSLKVIVAVCGALQKSDPALYKWKFNAIRVFVFIAGYFPRGKGKSPKQVLPPETITKEDLYNQIALAKEKLNNTTNFPARSNFKHPYFGVLNLKQTQKFLRLHTMHHLKICADIMNLS